MRRSLLEGFVVQNAAHALLQGAMLFRKQGEIGAPGRFRGLPFFGPREEIASFQGKRAALSAFDLPAHRIFPIRGVKREFPDIVTPVSRAPGRLFRIDAFQRLPQIGPMPCGTCETLRKHREKQLIFAHGGLPNYFASILMKPHLDEPRQSGRELDQVRLWNEPRKKCGLLNSRLADLILHICANACRR